MAPEHKARFCPRVQLGHSLTAEYHHSYRAPVRDLSRTGAFIEDDDLPFSVGQPIALTIWLTEGEAIEVDAIVRRSARGRGLGVEFVNMSSADTERLRAFLVAAQTKKAS